jgi:hypothetical protein
VTDFDRAGSYEQSSPVSEQDALTDCKTLDDRGVSGFVTGENDVNRGVGRSAIASCRLCGEFGYQVQRVGHERRVSEG